MPFGSFFPFPNHCAAPPQLTQRTASLASDVAPVAQHHSGVLRLDAVPPEIVLRVARALSPRDALALSQGCRRLFDALSLDIVAPLRLGERIRWVGSLSGFQAALCAIAAMPGDQRAALYQKLSERLRVFPPQLAEPARIALQPYFPSAQGAVHVAGAATATSSDTRLRALRARFSNDEGPPPPGEWMQLLEASPPSARGEILALMAGHIPDLDGYEHGVELLIAAVCESQEPDGMVSIAHAGVLAELAYRLVHDVPWGLAPPALARFWDKIFSLACRLPWEAQPKVMANLAEFVHRDGTNPEDDSAAVLTPRWARFIDHVSTRGTPADVVEILGELAQYNVEVEEDGGDPRSPPICQALCAAALSLPDESCARLLGQIVGYGLGDRQAYLALWDGALHASQAVTANVAAPLYSGLAKGIRTMSEQDQGGRWDALCQRIGAAAELVCLLDPLLDLAQLDVGKRSPERRAKLAGIGQRLHPEGRAALCAAMTVAQQITPDLWRAQVMAVCDLPGHVRREPAALLADLLFRYDSAFGPAPQDCLADPLGYACAEYPRTAGEALDKLSDLLGLLPLAHRGALLNALSSMNRVRPQMPLPWNVASVRWLLGEVMKLKPLHHHGIGAVTNIACVASIRCPTEADALAVLPALQEAVFALPADARASAAIFVGSLMQRLIRNNARTQSFGAQLLHELPTADVMALQSRKRKDPPQ